MAELDLTNVFNDCVDRLAQGQSIDECLRRYPQYASTLRPMLETSLLVQRMRVQPADVLLAQNHVRRRFEDALRAPPRRNISTLSRFVYALAALLIIGFIALGSLTVLSQNSLPGDSLYGAKLFSEGLQRSLFDSDSLETNFDQRHIQEIQQLLALGRAEDVTFSGTIDFQNGIIWTIASLSITVPNDMPNPAALHLGDKVEVTARTSELHTLTALSIRIIEPVPTPLPTVTIPVQTPTPTDTAAATFTSTPIDTTQAPQFTATAISPTECALTIPNGWVSYQIQSGDTLSALASGQSISLAELMATNCITDASRIVVGESIYLPSTLIIVPIATNNSNQGSGSNNSGSNIQAIPILLTITVEAIIADMAEVETTVEEVQTTIAAHTKTKGQTFLSGLSNLSGRI
jgi:hypothetical protein